MNNTQINQNNNQTNSTQVNNKTILKKFLILLMIVAIIIAGLTIYLLKEDNNKYNTYKANAADLVDFEKLYKRGVPYYRGTYKYTVKKREYFYEYDKLFTTTPDSVIQIKYNKTNPNDIYNEDLSKYYLIALLLSSSIAIISMIIAIISSKEQLEEIIVVQVVEQVTCVGGRRIYLNNININETDSAAYNTKYYVYFTNDLQKFAVGNYITFNIYKHGKVFVTERYKNIFARTIYDFKNEDFTHVNLVKDGKIISK